MSCDLDDSPLLASAEAQCDIHLDSNVHRSVLNHIPEHMEDRDQSGNSELNDEDDDILEELNKALDRLAVWNAVSEHKGPVSLSYHNDRRV